jgi:hypothetical protein
MDGHQLLAAGRPCVVDPILLRGGHAPPTAPDSMATTQDEGAALGAARTRTQLAASGAVISGAVLRAAPLASRHPSSRDANWDRDVTSSLGKMR